MLLTGCGSPAAPVIALASPSPSSSLQAAENAAGRVDAPPGLGGQERQAWLDRIERTVAVLVDSDLGPAVEGWDGRIVVELPDAGDYATLAGLVIEELGHLPSPGEYVTVNGWCFEVVDLDGRRIDKILARRP